MFVNDYNDLQEPLLPGPSLSIRKEREIEEKERVETLRLSLIFLSHCELPLNTIKHLERLNELYLDDDMWLGIWDPFEREIEIRIKGGLKEVRLLHYEDYHIAVSERARAVLCKYRKRFMKFIKKRLPGITYFRTLYLRF